MRVLNPCPGEHVIDGTAGDGGHVAAFLEKVGPGGLVLGIDWDKEAIKKLKERHKGRTHARFISGNYADLKEILKKEDIAKVDIVLLDLGFSSDQLENANRGFSFRRNEPLWMTYSDEQTPVRMLLKTLSEQELRQIIFLFGEERWAPKIAKAIKERVRTQAIETSDDLAEVIRKAVPAHYEHGRIDPATRTFQALRIYANNELGNLEKLLQDLPELLRVGGRAGIISFHSLEDRLVKKYFNIGKESGVFRILTKKPFEASGEEKRKNPRSRSAKLRVIQKI